jgi:hypothetical protein
MGQHRGRACQWGQFWCPGCRRVPWSTGGCNGGKVEDRPRGEPGGSEGAIFPLLDTLDFYFFGRTDGTK